MFCSKNRRAASATTLRVPRASTVPDAIVARRVPAARPRQGRTANPNRLQRAAGDGRRGRGSALCARRLPGEVLLDAPRARAPALDDAQEVGHARDLLDLLLDEPLHELLGGVV